MDSGVFALGFGLWCFTVSGLVVMLKGWGFKKVHVCQTLT